MDELNEQIHKIISKNKLTDKLSKRHISLLTRLVSQAKTNSPFNKNKKKRIEELRDLIATANSLAGKLKEYHPEIAYTPDDIFSPVLNDWIARWQKSLCYIEQQKQSAGATRKNHHQIFFVLFVIDIYCEVTGESYVQQEFKSVDRERTVYNPRCYSFAKTLLKLAYPKSDAAEIMKAARRDSLLTPIFENPLYKSLKYEYFISSLQSTIAENRLNHVSDNYLIETYNQAIKIKPQIGGESDDILSNAINALSAEIKKRKKKNQK